MLFFLWAFCCCFNTYIIGLHLFKCYLLFKLRMTSSMARAGVVIKLWRSIAIWPARGMQMTVWQCNYEIGRPIHIWNWSLSIVTLSLIPSARWLGCGLDFFTDINGYLHCSVSSIHIIWNGRWLWKARFLSYCVSHIRIYNASEQISVF